MLVKCHITLAIMPNNVVFGGFCRCHARCIHSCSIEFMLEIDVHAKDNQDAMQILACQTHALMPLMPLNAALRLKSNKTTWFVMLGIMGCYFSGDVNTRNNFFQHLLSTLSANRPKPAATKQST